MAFFLTPSPIILRNLYQVSHPPHLADFPSCLGYFIDNPQGTILMYKFHSTWKICSAKIGRVLARTKWDSRVEKGTKKRYSLYALFQITILRPVQLVQALGRKRRTKRWKWDPNPSRQNWQTALKLEGHLNNHTPAKVLWQPLGDGAKTLRRSSADGSSISTASGLTLIEYRDQVRLSNLWCNSHLAWRRSLGRAKIFGDFRHNDSPKLGVQEGYL